MDLITDLMRVGAGAITGLLVGLTGVGGGALAVVLFSVGAKLWWAALG